MASSDNLFNVGAPCFSISVTATTSSPIHLPVKAHGVGTTIRLVNAGTKICYVSLGVSSVAATVPSGTAATTCTPVLPGQDRVFTFGPAQSWIAAICGGSDSTTLLVQVGSGA